LFGTFSAHYRSIEVEYKTGLWSVIILVCLEASVGVTFYNELFFTPKNYERILISSKVLKDALYNCLMIFTKIWLIPARNA
jgi:hypothetical protein